MLLSITADRTFLPASLALSLNFAYGYLGSEKVSLRMHCSSTNVCDYMQCRNTKGNTICTNVFSARILQEHKSNHILKRTVQVRNADVVLCFSKMIHSPEGH